MSTMISSTVNESLPTSSASSFGLSSQLPEEIWMEIFSYLDPDTLIDVLRVCKSWNLLSQKEECWKKAFFKWFGCGPYASGSFFIKRSNGWQRVRTWKRSRKVKRQDIDINYPSYSEALFQVGPKGHVKAILGWQHQGFKAYQLETGEKQSLFIHQASLVTCFKQFYRHGSTLVGTEHGAIQVFDQFTPIGVTNHRTFRDHHQGAVWHLEDWGPRSVVSVGSEGCVIFWNYITGFAKERMPLTQVGSRASLEESQFLSCYELGLLVLLTASGHIGVYRTTDKESFQFSFSSIYLGLFPQPGINFEPHSESFVVWSPALPICLRYSASSLQTPVAILGAATSRGPVSQKDSISLLDGHISPILSTSNTYTSQLKAGCILVNQSNSSSEDFGSPLVSGDQLGIACLWGKVQQHSFASASTQATSSSSSISSFNIWSPPPTVPVLRPHRVFQLNSPIHYLVMDEWKIIAGCEDKLITVLDALRGMVVSTWDASDNRRSMVPSGEGDPSDHPHPFLTFRQIWCSRHQLSVITDQGRMFFWNFGDSSENPHPSRKKQKRKSKVFASREDSSQQMKEQVEEYLEDQEEEEYLRSFQQQTLDHMNGVDVAKVLSDRELLDYVKIMSLEQPSTSHDVNGDSHNTGIDQREIDDDLQYALELSKIEK